MSNFFDELLQGFTPPPSMIPPQQPKALPVDDSPVQSKGQALLEAERGITQERARGDVLLDTSILDALHKEFFNNAIDKDRLKLLTQYAKPGITTKKILEVVKQAEKAGDEISRLSKLIDQNKDILRPLPDDNNLRRNEDKLADNRLGQEGLKNEIKKDRKLLESYDQMKKLGEDIAATTEPKEKEKLQKKLADLEEDNGVKSGKELDTAIKIFKGRVQENETQVTLLSKEETELKETRETLQKGADLVPLKTRERVASLRKDIEKKEEEIVKLRIEENKPLHLVIDPKKQDAFLVEWATLTDKDKVQTYNSKLRNPKNQVTQSIEVVTANQITNEVGQQMPQMHVEAKGDNVHLALSGTPDKLRLTAGGAQFSHQKMNVADSIKAVQKDPGNPDVPLVFDDKGKVTAVPLNVPANQFTDPVVTLNLPNNAVMNLTGIKVSDGPKDKVIIESFGGGHLVMPDKKLEDRTKPLIELNILESRGKTATISLPASAKMSANDTSITLNNEKLKQLSFHTAQGEVKVLLQRESEEGAPVTNPVNVNLEFTSKVPGVKPRSVPLVVDGKPQFEGDANTVGIAASTLVGGVTGAPGLLTSALDIAAKRAEFDKRIEDAKREIAEEEKAVQAQQKNPPLPPAPPPRPGMGR